ncbi:MAG: response regulator [Caldilinea sp.]|nr:response regulator [Caldilinea sp.]
MAVKILVADDDPMLQRLIMNTLKLEQYEVVIASDGQQALELARSEKPDLIILDVMMPIKNGFEVCADLRKIPETAALPVIILSGLGQVQEKIAGLKAGADEYVTKPIDPRELLTRVEMLLLRNRVLRESSAQRAGRVTCVIGAKGGVGTTTLAVNLAALLSSQDRSTIIVELRPDFGTVAVQLKLTPAQNLSNIRDLEPAALTDQLVERLLADTSYGGRALCGPQRVQEFGPIDAKLAGSLLARLVMLADDVVVDLPSTSGELVEAAVRSAGNVIVTLEADIAGVAAAEKRLQQLQGYEKSLRMHPVVVNRQGTMLLSMREIETRLNHSLSGMLPPATDVMGVSIQYGSPLAVFQPNHIFCTQLAELAERVLESRRVSA